MSSSARRQAACKALLLCTTSDISPENKDLLSRIMAKGLDWEYLLDLAEFHNIIPLVMHNLTTNGFHNHVPQPYLNRMESAHNSTLYKNVTLSSELSDLLSAFKKRGIAIIPLKGTILAETLYGNPALRAIADMDILVHPEDIPQAKTLLTELGYKQMPTQSHWDHRFHEVPYCKEAAFPFFIELHWNLEDRRFMTVPEEEIWHRAQSLELSGITTTVLSPEDNLLFLSIHLSKQSDGLLKFLGDIAELLKKYESTLDWDYIITSARSWQSETVVYHALRLARDLLNAPVPLSCLKALEPDPWRRRLLGFLATQEYFITPISDSRIRGWTSVVARSLMMEHKSQMLAVLSKQQGPWKKGAWLRTVFWVTLVLVAALARNLGRVFFRQ